MAFGQQSGHPATGRQVNELLELLHQAGHTDFRDARGPMGFTQRQAGGKFTADEATAFIDQLNDEIFGAGEPPAPEPPAPAQVAKPTKSARPAKTVRSIRDIPDATLAAELQRRGWIVVEP